VSGASGSPVNVVRMPCGVSSGVPSSRSGIGSSSWIVSLGRPPATGLAVRKTLPPSGFASSGVAASTVPTLVVSGQPRMSASSGWQVTPSRAKLGAATGGSVTETAFWFASPSRWRTTVRIGGSVALPVLPLAPIEASMRGANGSAPQSVGVKRLDRVTGLAPSVYGVAAIVDVAGPHDVGLRMNAPFAPGGLPKSVNVIRSV
jgi:hypothetical protein